MSNLLNADRAGDSAVTVNSLREIIAASPCMLDIFETVCKVADFKTSVMIYGESGTGKELIAKALHNLSQRRNKKFIAINCAAIPENLLESELFGHKKGAFTDALKDKKGLFEEAHGGTVFLDEIGELPLHLQAKLLRAIQLGEICPVGDTQTISVDIRIITATLRDLETAVLDSRFRDDLYYRLNVININVPPLRERKEDIPLLVDHFIKQKNARMNINIKGISKEALECLLKYSWPGNIRELENCIERVMILCEGEIISKENLPRAVLQNSVSDTYAIEADDNLSIKEHTRRLEKHLIKQALIRTKGNRTQAAKLLEVSHRTLLYKIKEFGLENFIPL